MTNTDQNDSITDMCSEYTVKIKANEIEAAVNASLKNLSGQKSWEQKVRFTNYAPVILKDKKGLILDERVFPANPFPNARLSGLESKKGKDDDELIRRIYDVPLWKKGFAEHPLLVPMTGFIEPVYWGDEKGTAVQFSLKKYPLFFVAAIGIKPRVPYSTKVNGFALLTHTATKQMLNYHHRLITILKPNDALGYLEDMTPQERFDFLIEKRITEKFETVTDRSMARGWEKRVSQHEHKLLEEETYIKTLEKENVDG